MFRPTSPQLSMLEPSFQLSPVKRKRLVDSWAHDFRERVLPLIDEEPLRDAFCQDNGRPNTSIRLLMGLSLLKEMFDLTDDEALAYARAATTPDVDRQDFRYRAARRTDGRARACMFASVVQGVGVDQRRTVEEAPVPLAIINGENDRFLNPDYFAKPRYANLWRGSVQRIAGAGHAPFFEQPEVYNSLLQAFFADCLAGA